MPSKREVLITMLLSFLAYFTTSIIGIQRKENVMDLKQLLMDAENCYIDCCDTVVRIETCLHTYKSLNEDEVLIERAKSRLHEAINIRDRAFDDYLDALTLLKMPKEED